MNDLERRYRLLLLAFPRRYRDRRGEEMVGTLMEAAGPDQHWPSAGDAADLVDGGLQARAGLSAQSAIGSVLGLAAPYGLAVAAGLASVCLIFGEFEVPGIWHRGWQPNQFTGLRFETHAVPFYGLVLLAFVATVSARTGLSRVLAIAGCIAGYLSYSHGGLRSNGRPPVDLLALIFVALVPTVVAPALGRSLKGVLVVVAAVVVASVAVVPAHDLRDTRAAFYADAPTGVIEARPYLLAGCLVLILGLVALAYRRQRWQIAAAAGLLLLPLVGLLTAQRFRSRLDHHWEVLLAALEVVVLAVAVGLAHLNQVIVVSRRREDS